MLNNDEAEVASQPLPRCEVEVEAKYTQYIILYRPSQEEGSGYGLELRQ